MPRDIRTIFDNLTHVSPENLDREVLRAAILSELETINMFEQLAEMTRSRELRATLLNVIRGKRMHVGEFQALLMQLGLPPEELLKDFNPEGPAPSA